MNELHKTGQQTQRELSGKINFLGHFTDVD